MQFPLSGVRWRVRWHFEIRHFAPVKVFLASDALEGTRRWAGTRGRRSLARDWEAAQGNDQVKRTFRYTVLVGTGVKPSPLLDGAATKGANSSPASASSGCGRGVRATG